MTPSPEGYNPLETQADDRLPRERLRAISVKRMVLEWLVAGCVVLSINVAAFAAMDRYDPNRFRVQVAVKYELLRERGAQYDSLILGDSTPNQGVIPSILDEQVGGRWINLATVANLLTISNAWLLEEYIDSYGPPKNVVIALVPDMWPREADPVVFSQAEVPISSFAGLNPPLSLSAREKLRMFATRYLPLYSKNESLNQLIRKPWKVEDLRGGFSEDGFMVTHEQEDGWLEDLEVAKLEHWQQPFSVSEINEQGMRRVIELAELHGFIVYLTPGSASEGLATSPGYARNFNGMIEAYRAWANSSDNLVLILPEPQTFPDEMMYDEDHVLEAGAVVWSTRIAESILVSKANEAESAERVAE